MFKKIKIHKCSMIAVLMASVSHGLIAQNALAQSQENKLELDEVIVTAERRSESVQDLALSISAVSGDKLEKLGIRDVSDLQNFIPGLNVKTSTLGGTKFNIRGVGQTSDNITVESGVGVFIDDIFLPCCFCSF